MTEQKKATNLMDNATDKASELASAKAREKQNQ